MILGGIGDSLTSIGVGLVATATAIAELIEVDTAVAVSVATLLAQRITKSVDRCLAAMEQQAHKINRIEARATDTRRRLARHSSALRAIVDGDMERARQRVFRSHKRRNQE